MSAPDRRPAAHLLKLTLAATLMGSLCGTDVTCEDSVRSALLTGARSGASALLNVFFDNIESGSNFTPVTVKSING